MGEANVRAAQRKNKEKGLPTDLWSIPLNKNGLIYVERLYAFSELLKNSKKYGVTYPEIPYKPYFKKVKLRDRVTTNYIAQYTGVPLKTIEALNPGFKSPNRSTKLVKTVLVPLNAANNIPTPPKAKKKKSSKKVASKTKKNSNKNNNKNNKKNLSNKK
jgi:membrane-bound lytic murein transglycosylase D